MKDLFDRKLDAYYNLHKHTFSLKEVSGRVLDHRDTVVMRDVEFVVQPAGRKRVVEQGRKNVHAFCRGHVVREPWTWEMKRRVSYDPYKYPFFYDVQTGEKIEQASLVMLRDKKVYILEE